MARRKRGQILLVAIEIHDRVGGNSFGAVGENVLPGRRIDARQLVRRDLEPVRDRRCWSRGEAGIDGKWSRAGERIVLVKIGRDGGDGAAGAEMDLVAGQPIQLNAWSQAVEIEAITRLWIDDELLRHPGGGSGKSNARGPFRALGDGRIQLVAQTVIEHQARRDLPRVLGEEAQTRSG